MTRILLATGNRGKVAELRDLLGPEVEVVTPEECSLEIDVEENGDSFADNARLKALAYCQASGELCVADDSGLCVDALGGAPGVRSARFAADADCGEGDLANRAYLLQRLAGVPAAQRGAHFHCTIAIAHPTAPLRVFEGRCDGRIAEAPRGASGFGYDPLFVGDDGRTFAEISLAEKQAVSHRGRALRAAAPYLRDLLAARPAVATAGE